MSGSQSADAKSIAWSPDGQQLAFAEVDLEYAMSSNGLDWTHKNGTVAHIYLVNINGSDLRNLVSSYTIYDNASNLRWSNDGTRLFGSSDTDPSINSSGSDFVVDIGLLSMDIRVVYDGILPDFICDYRSGQMLIKGVDLSGLLPGLKLDNGNCSFSTLATWSWNREYVAFIARVIIDNQQRYGLVLASTERAEVLVSMSTDDDRGWGPINFLSFEWSPDKRILAYALSKQNYYYDLQGNYGELYTLNSDGAKGKLILRVDEGSIANVAWQP